MKGCFWGLCCVCVLAACLTGCRKEESPESGSTAESQERYTEEVQHLVVTYPTLPNSVVRDLEAVTDKVNEIAVEEIGVEVEFRLVDTADAATDYPLWISREEQIDLMMLYDQDIAAYISRSMLLPLDELMAEWGPGISGLLDEGCYVTEGSVVRNQTYGAAAVPEIQGNGTGLWVPLSLLEETGFHYDQGHIYTRDELSDFFDSCKELYPDAYALGQITAGSTSTTFSYYGGNLKGEDILSGVLTGDGRMENVFELPEYLNFLEDMQEWYEAGYLYPDGAFTDSYLEELVSSGLVLTYPGSSIPGYVADEIFGEKAVVLRTSEISVWHQSSKSGFWTIPVTSGDPEAAMRFLNLLYTDSRISNLIQYGIAGRHYVVLDVETGRISYPYGVSRKSTGYYNPLAVYGDRRRMYTTDTNEVMELKQKYAHKAAETQEEFNDFYFETDSVEPELAAVRKVIEEYLPALESGSVEISVYYPEFIARLKMAGMDRIIDEKQKQYDAWLLKSK